MKELARIERASMHIDLDSRLRILRDVVDYATDSARAITQRSCASQHFDTIHALHTRVVVPTVANKQTGRYRNSVFENERVKEVISFVKQKGGMEYTIAKMNEYQQKALAILETYPNSPYKDSLLTMVNYVIERKI